MWAPALIHVGARPFILERTAESDFLFLVLVFLLEQSVLLRFIIQLRFPPDIL